MFHTKYKQHICYLVLFDCCEGNYGNEIEGMVGYEVWVVYINYVVYSSVLFIEHVMPYEMIIKAFIFVFMYNFAWTRDNNKRFNVIEMM